MEHEELLLPDYITDLADAEDCADCYEPACDGVGYRLTDQARAARDDCKAELKRYAAETAAKIDGLNAEIEKRDLFIVERVRHNAIIDALRRAGVNSKLIDVAAIYLISAMEIVVTEEGGEMLVEVVDPFGKISVDQAVSTWLASEEGAPFAPKQATHEVSGPFSDAIRRLN